MSITHRYISGAHAECTEFAHSVRGCTCMHAGHVHAHVSTGIHHASCEHKEYATRTHYLPILQIHLCTHGCLHDRKVYRCLQTMCVLYIYALHTNKYTIHAWEHRIHTHAHTMGTPGTPMHTIHFHAHTNTHAYSHFTYTTSCVHACANPHSKPHTGLSVFLFLLPS